MKVNELTIGSIVEYFGDPAVIREISESGGCLVKCGYCNYHTSVETILPISLSDDFLAKNFEKNVCLDGSDCYYYGDEYFDVQITPYTDGIWEVFLCPLESGGLPSWIMYVSEVHKLQQALMVAGVNMELSA